MWDDLLMTAGDVLLALIPDPSKADDFFIADVLETRQESRFPGRKCYAAFLRPLTHQPAAWYDCRKNICSFWHQDSVFLWQSARIRLSACLNCVNQIKELQINPKRR